jgi:arsenate reductase-like glutaredoxin family protein
MSTVLFSNEHKEHKHLSYDASITLLQSIQNNAIVLGNGKKMVYVFIDPLCPHSRKFIKMVSENPIMLSKYQYHLFLYSIPRMKSTDVVSAIYMSKNSLGTLLSAMVDEDVHYDKGNDITQARVDRIAEVAQEMDVYKRPYIFIIK